MPHVDAAAFRLRALAATDHRQELRKSVLNDSNRTAKLTKCRDLTATIDAETAEPAKTAETQKRRADKLQQTPTRRIRQNMAMLKTPLIVPVALVVAASQIVAGREAQTPADVTFEVASIKPNNSGGKSTTISVRPGLYTATNVSLEAVIINAYHLQDFQLSGGPAWVRSDRFDIVAKVAADVPPVSAAPQDNRSTDLDAMLKSLLKDRFKLVMHTERRNGPVYALAAARSDKRLGPQIHPTVGECLALPDQMTLKQKENKEKSKQTPGNRPAPGSPGQRSSCVIKVEPGRMSARGTTLAALASSLSGVVPRTVVDRTGIDGLFDVELTWTPDQLPHGDTSVKSKPSKIDPNGPSLFTALREQLGLKLESTRGTVDVLVVDSAERPTPN